MTTTVTSVAASSKRVRRRSRLVFQLGKHRQQQRCARPADEARRHHRQHEGDRVGGQRLDAEEAADGHAITLIDGKESEAGDHRRPGERKNAPHPIAVPGEPITGRGEDMRDGELDERQTDRDPHHGLEAADPQHRRIGRSKRGGLRNQLHQHGRHVAQVALRAAPIEIEKGADDRHGGQRPKACVASWMPEEMRHRRREEEQQQAEQKSTQDRDRMRRRDEPADILGGGLHDEAIDCRIAQHLEDLQRDRQRRRDTEVAFTQQMRQ